MIKWIYITKTTGNVALGNIKATANYDIYGTVTAENLTINSGKNCTIYNGGILYAANLTNSGTYTNLIVEDGGQLITNSTGVQATLKKNIAPATGDRDNWYFIAAPMASPFAYDNTGYSNLIAGTYDLYVFDQAGDAEGKEWLNFRESNNNLSDITLGKGYLYANTTENFTLQLMGAVNATTNTVDLDYTADKDWTGWNLIGNPFTGNATIDMPFYRLSQGEYATVSTEGQTVNALEGVFVQATEQGQSATFTKVVPEATNNGDVVETDEIAQLNISISRNRGTVVDNAIVRFDGGSTLGKFQFNGNHAKVYFTEGNHDYAIVSSEAQGEMPVNFRASENGTYTLSVDVENVEMTYLHLIDNMTGADVDLLSSLRSNGAMEYSFEAKTTDYASRFKLVFAQGESANEDNFAFMRNNHLLVLGIEGQATLQVIDLMGRILSSETINGNVSKAVNAPAGVYVLRLINGDEVKTQKIVVR